ncbi:MAG TPA: GNAT family N-acetyltransferase [Thermoleophilaceae bacterium]
MTTDIRQLTTDELREAGRVLTDALVDDPGWVAVAPGSRQRRRRLADGYHRAMLRVTQRHGRPIHGAFRDGRLAGVAATFAAGLYPPPMRTFAHYVPSFLRAGPGATARGLRFSAIQERGHPEEEHVYLWFLGVDPSLQRAGVGRALLGQVFDDACAIDVPVYLDTSNPANVPYYASFGFEVIGEADLFRGARIWFLRRP